MKLTVAICTWNRHNLLDQTLAEMRKLRIPQGIEWELLVVNNNCTDNTDPVIAHHAKNLPIHRVFEPNAGLSNARNAAVSAAMGDYILWTDDDVLVDEYWAEAYVKAFERWPELAVFGGPINPWFERKPPRWLAEVWERISFAYAVCDHGPDPIFLGEKSLPYGANYAMRLSFQKQYSYDPSLGRKEKGMLGGEEESVIRAMLRDGLKGIWVPEAKVRHFIPYKRQNTHYLRHYFRGQGFVSTRGTEPPKSVTIWGYPRWLIRRAIQAELRYYLHRLYCPPSLWIEDLIGASWLWGRLKGKADSVY